MMALRKYISRCNSGRVSGGISEDRTAAKTYGKQWPISYLWEHVLVLEHQIPIWFILVDVKHVWTYYNTIRASEVRLDLL